MGVGAVYHCSTMIKSSFLTFRKHFQTYTLLCTVHIKKLVSIFFCYSYILFNPSSSFKHDVQGPRV